MPSETRRILGRAAVLALFIAACGAVAPVLAAEPEAPAPGPVTNTWFFWPKAGAEPAFEQGLRAHAAWRKAAGEGWTWEIYQPAVGADLGYYVVRSGGHPWSDLDANEEWNDSSRSFEKYMEQLGASVERVEHYLGLSDPKHSKWEEGDYEYFGVTSLVLRPGAYGEMLEALDKVHKATVEKKWPRSYAIEWTIGGDGAMLLIVPYRSWAEMAEPEPALIQVLAEALGSMEAAAATMKQLGSSFGSESYTIYRRRPDLSTPK